MLVLHSIASLAGKALRKVRAGEKKITSLLVARDLPPSIVVESPSFRHGEAIPYEHVAFDGYPGRSPALKWSGVPMRAKELVLVCEDPDAPFAKPFVHWTAYRIPPQIDRLPAGLSRERNTDALGGTLQGHNTPHKLGYIGPKPPAGHGVHHYHFQLFALDAPLANVGDWVDREELVHAMTGHVIAHGEIVGTYENR